MLYIGYGRHSTDKATSQRQIRIQSEENPQLECNLRLELMMKRNTHDQFYWQSRAQELINLIYIAIVPDLSHCLSHQTVAYMPACAFLKR